MNSTKAPLDDMSCGCALSGAFDYATAIQMIAVKAFRVKRDSRYRGISLCLHVTNDARWLRLNLKSYSAAGSPATGAFPLGTCGAKGAENLRVLDMDAAKAFLGACK